MSQAEIFQEAIELRAKLAASEVHVATLRGALELALGLVACHHDAGLKMELGKECPECLRGDRWERLHALFAAPPADMLATVVERLRGGK